MPENAHMLAAAMADRLPGSSDNGLRSMRALPAADRQVIATRMAGAFQHTYGWAVALMAVALLPAALLPRPTSQNKTIERRGRK